ncbi:unnamed protein product, partial [Allacma fusca]
SEMQDKNFVFLHETNTRIAIEAIPLIQFIKGVAFALILGRDVLLLVKHFEEAGSHTNSSSILEIISKIPNHTLAVLLSMQIVATFVVNLLMGILLRMGLR